MIKRKKVGSVNAEDKRIYGMIVNILRIKDEPDMQEELMRWIQKDGIDRVFETVIRIYTTYSMD